MPGKIEDIVEFGKAEALNGLILIIDYAKGFDTLSVNVIIKASKYFNIGANFIKLIEIVLYKRVSCVRNGVFRASAQHNSRFATATMHI